MDLWLSKDRADILTAIHERAELKSSAVWPMTAFRAARVYKPPACWFGVFCSSLLAIQRFSKTHNEASDETAFSFSEKHFLARNVLFLQKLLKPHMARLRLGSSRTTQRTVVALHLIFQTCNGDTDVWINVKSKPMERAFMT